MRDKSTLRSTVSNLRAAICSVVVCAAAISVQADTITVITTADSGPGSLRQALADSNDGDTINFAVTGTIGLTSAELLVNKSVTISGPGAPSLAVDGNATSRVLHIGAGKTVSISGLTLTNGNVVAVGNGCGLLNDHAVLTMDSCAVHNNYSTQLANGGGVYNDGSAGSATLTILNSAITTNHAYSAGGGIYNDANNGGSAMLTITNSSVSDNNAAFINKGFSGGEGGGIYNGGGTVVITSSRVNGNSAGLDDPSPLSYGGGISNYGTLTITNSTINSNQCGLAGGGIYTPHGTLTITSSTVSNNAADGSHDGKPWGHGGGIVAGTLTFTNSTLSGNYANISDGGITLGGGTITNGTISDNNGSISFGGGGGLEIGNTILNATAGSANIINYGGTITSAGYNLSNDDGGGYLNGPGDQINTDPLLGPLQDNGGPTFTHELLSGSPAIDAGNPKFTPPPFYDQRGPDFYRVRNNRIDIGSFEVQNGPALTPTPSPTPTPTVPPTATPTPTPSPRPIPTPRGRPAPRLRPTPR